MGEEALDEATEIDRHASESPCRGRIKLVRVLFQVLGAVVCFLFVIQGVLVFVNTQGVGDFWQACHWVAEGLLCVIIGLIGMLLEARALFPSVRRHLARFAVHRLGLALVYLWVGCYSMSPAVDASSTGWKIVGRVTGLLAWVVGFVDILMSCCSDRAEAEPTRIQVRPVDDDALRQGGNASAGGTEHVEPECDGGDNPFSLDMVPEDDSRWGHTGPMPSFSGWNDACFKPFGTH